MGQITIENETIWCKLEQAPKGSPIKYIGTVVCTHRPEGHMSQNFNPHDTTCTISDKQPKKSWHWWIDLVKNNQTLLQWDNFFQNFLLCFIVQRMIWRESLRRLHLPLMQCENSKLVLKTCGVKQEWKHNPFVNQIHRPSQRNKTKNKPSWVHLLLPNPTSSPTSLNSNSRCNWKSFPCQNLQKKWKTWVARSCREKL